MQHSRSYQYAHHLLQQYSSYGGTCYQIEWISLAALRERWRTGEEGGELAGELTQADFAPHFPIYLNNSYQARVVATSMLDGSWRHRIEYLDTDTTLVTEPDGARFEFQFNEQWLVTRLLQFLPGETRPINAGRRRWSEHGLLLEESDAEHNLIAQATSPSTNMIDSATSLSKPTRWGR